MNFAFVPIDWQVSISQSVIASVLVLTFQLIFTYIFRKILNRKGNGPRGYIWSNLYLLSYSVPFLALLAISASSDEISRTNMFFIACGAGVFAYATKRKISILEAGLRDANLFKDRLESAGVKGAIIDPTVEDYKSLLKRTITGFSLLGIGAEKLTRDFETFRDAMNRCSSPEKPARLLLVAPDVAWVNDGASRRGLGKNHFKDILINSLKSIARLKKDYNTPIEVRFYRGKPLFRLLFINEDECWFGYYSESVINSGENEFQDKSHTTLIVKRPGNKPPDREFYGATEAYFNELWDKSEGDKWDFKRFLK